MNGFAALTAIALLIFPGFQSLAQDTPCDTLPVTCCADIGGITIYFGGGGVPIPPNVSLSAFTINDILFVRVWDTLKFDGTTLQLTGQTDWQGTFHDAEVLLDLIHLPCLACSITASVATGNEPTRLFGFGWGSLNPIASHVEENGGDVRLNIQTGKAYPFTGATISGHETQIRQIVIE